MDKTAWISNKNWFLSWRHSEGLEKLRLGCPLFVVIYLGMAFIANRAWNGRIQQIQKLICSDKIILCVSQPPDFQSFHGVFQSSLEVALLIPAMLSPPACQHSSLSAARQG